MDRFLRNLNSLKNSEPFFLSIYNEVEKYIKGESTMEDMLGNVLEEYWPELASILNKVIVFKNTDLNYYVQLPTELEFGDINPPAIIVARVNSLGVMDNSISIVGPDYLVTDDSQSDVSYVQVKGDFSSIPNGAVISFEDYLRIIKKYSGLYEVICGNLDDEKFQTEEFRNKVKNSVDKFIARVLSGKYSNKNLSFSSMEVPLSREIIDSISFVQDEYFTYEDLLNGDLLTFSELVSQIETKMYGSKLTLDKKDNN